MDAEDDDLARAIALSLEEANHPPPNRDATPGSSDDDIEDAFQRDLAAAIAASKAEDEAASSKSRAVEPSTSTSKAQSIPPPAPVLLPNKASQATQPPPTESTSKFMSERAKLEKERLERMKRMREVTESEDGPSAKKAKVTPPPPRHLNGAIASSSANTTDTPWHASSLPASSNVDGSSERFWEGALRQTANMHVDKAKDTKPVFRLTDIIGTKSDVSFAILSSYSNMEPWLYERFDPQTPVILVNQPDSDGKSAVEPTFSNWIRTRPFLRNGRGAMHIKLILLFYKDGRLRVAVPTANFVDYDWAEIENSVWVQDIPLRQTPIRHDAKAADFPATLQRVLHQLNVPAALNAHINGDHPNLPIESLMELRMRWDWSKVKVKLVASLAGKHEGWDEVNRTGHPALMKAIQDIKARAGKHRTLTIECQGSSIGTYSTQWVNEFFCSARGESARTWIDRPKTQRAKLPWPSVKIVFPSKETVRKSKLGYAGGGTMFCRKNQWEAKNFPRGLFYDSNSKRGGVLMHSKMIIGTFKSTKKESSSSSGKGKQIEFTDSEDEDSADERGGADKDIVGWAYVGSHNFTPSAWGTLSGSSSSPSLNVVNYEMGIVIPLKSEKEVDAVACWERPARKYNLSVDRAWIQEEVLGTMFG